MGARRRIVAGKALSALIVIFGGIAGCGSSDPEEPAAEPGVIRLGTMFDLTGADARDGEMMLKAQQLAVKEANDAGGVLGRQVELVNADDECDPGAGVAAANKLIEQDIVVSVGGACSSATVPTLKIFHDAKVPMIIPVANSTELLAPGYDDVFLVSGTVVAEGKFAVDVMQKLGTKRLTIVHDGTSFPQTLAQSTADAAAAQPAAGVTVTGQIPLSQGAPNYSRIAKQVIDSTADTVMYTGYALEANQLIKDLRAAGYTGKVVGGDGLSDDETLLKGLTEQQIAEVYRITLASPDFMPSIGEWAQRFNAANGSPPITYTVEAYDAVVLALDAIRRAGSLEYAAVRQAIADSKDVKLLTGDPRFNSDGSRVSSTFLLLRTDAGKFKFVMSNRDLTTPGK